MGKKIADYLYNFACCRMQDKEFAKDLVQDTFLAALEKISAFEGKSTERTWLSAILKYKIIDAYRAGKTSHKKLQQTGEAFVEREFFQQVDGHWNVEDRPKQMTPETNFNVESKELSIILTKCI